LAVAEHIAKIELLNLDYVTFLAAGTCLSWRLPSITEQQVNPHRLPHYMYAVLAEETLTRLSSILSQAR